MIEALRIVGIAGGLVVAVVLVVGVAAWFVFGVIGGEERA